MGQRHLASTLLLLALACDEAPRAEPDPSADPSDLVDNVLGDEATDGQDSDESGDETEAMRLDVPAPVEMACQKIDFLFVIDDSGSMGDEQARLIDGFPGFIDGVQDAIAQYDYHMMVVTTGFNPIADDPLECDTAIGAGRVAASDGASCGIAGEESEHRFATANDEGLSDVFSCVAEVGVHGSGNERPIWAMAQAITTHAFPGGCNEGFLRDDAILVVTIITDEEDDASADSPGDPALWRDVMVSAKHGEENSIVMLGLLGDTDLDDGVCEPFDTTGAGAEGGPRLREFVESFEYGSWASVCLDDYAPFFNAAVVDIGEACVDFVPPG